MTLALYAVYLVFLFCLLHNGSCTFFNFPKVFHGLGNNLRDRIDDFHYKSLAQYQERIGEVFKTYFENFNVTGVLFVSDAQTEFENYVTRLQATYNETLKALSTQRSEIQHLELKTYSRPKQFDESLEQFRKFYDDYMHTYSFHGNNTRHKSWNFWWSSNEQNEPFAEQINRLNHNLKENWDSVSRSASDASSSTETAIKQSLKDLNAKQDEMITNAQLLVKQYQDSIKETISKNDLRKQRRELEYKLKQLEHESYLWLDSQVQQFEVTLKTLQEKLIVTNSIYDELVDKKKESVEMIAMNDATLRKALTLMDTNDGWKLLKSEDNIEVYRKFLSGVGSQFACVMCNGVINSPPSDVLALFTDFTRIREYNGLFEAGKEIEAVSDNTKIVWCCSSTLFPFKPRDFCTVIHVRKLKDGTCVVLNRATSHPNAPSTSKYVRGSIHIAANIIQPMPGQPKKCRLTMITQIDPGGVAPAPIINHLCALGPVGFMKNVEEATKRKGYIAQAGSIR